MTNNQLESHPVLSWHLLFLGRIYSFLGWLGMLGALFLFLTGFSPQPEGQQPASILAGLPWFVSPLLLAGWSTILINFGKDIVNQRRWTTSISGCFVALFSLISVPIGTAVGTYTLWVLFRYRKAAQQQ